ncbi:hypothetical protein OAN24_06300, partial [Pseudodesulfovibrio sp.]|nr:hypothetical protein [Pseudodesulfovibrio sp.]
MKQYLIIIISILLVVPAFSADWTVEELKESLAEAKVQLVKCRAEYERLNTIGYGGPVLRKELELLSGKVAGLIHEIEGINKHLSDIEATPLIGDAVVSLKATKESYDGPPLKGSLESGDIIALQGTVKIPGEKDTMLQSYIIWQLFAANGEQVADYYKRDEIWKVGEHKTKVRFLINELKSGQYTAALSHVPADNPAKMARAKVSFAVSAPLFVNDAWITDEPGGSAVSTLGTGKKPYFYITFGVESGIENVTVQFRAKDTGTGKDLTLEMVDYAVKPDKEEQRVGIMLEEYAIRDATGVSFEARLTLGDGPPIVVERSLALVQQTYTLKLRAAPTVLSGENGPFSITLPDNFVRPFSVQFFGRGLNVHKSSNPLKGTFKGAAHGADKSATLRAIVTDSEGRRAEGTTFITIKAADEKVLASQKKQKLYSKPPASSQSSYSQPSGASGSGQYGSIGRQRVMKVINDIASGVGPPCAASLTAPYQNFIVNKLRNWVEDDYGMEEVGRKSGLEWDNWVKTN